VSSNIYWFVGGEVPEESQDDGGERGHVGEGEEEGGHQQGEVRHSQLRVIAAPPSVTCIRVSLRVLTYRQSKPPLLLLKGRNKLKGVSKDLVGKNHSTLTSSSGI